ncbi:MAG: hypothetical protein AAF411_10795 [Myxococcota bacterium]
MRIDHFFLSFAALLVIGCGDDATLQVDAGLEDMARDASPQCPELRGRERICDGPNNVAACVNGSVELRPCGVGTECQVDGGDAVCACTDASDGTCPSGCPSDPDCVGCAPECGEATCGNDGCGGACGSCAEGEYCRTRSCETAPPGTLCDNRCGFSGDGECDDGGEGALFSVCEFGTDCDDCGPREPVMDAGVPDLAVPDSDVPDSGTSIDGGPIECSLAIPCPEGLFCTRPRIALPSECRGPSNFFVAFGEDNDGSIRNGMEANESEAVPRSAPGLTTSPPSVYCEANGGDLGVFAATTLSGESFTFSLRGMDWDRATGSVTPLSVAIGAPDTVFAWMLGSSCEIEADPNPDGSVGVSFDCLGTGDFSTQRAFGVVFCSSLSEG